jgi:hypothetical protein
MAGRLHDGGDPLAEHTKTALLVGLTAAVVGGAVWALIVVLTGYEVGWVAWGVGALVGGAMAWATPLRSRALGVRAGVLAAAGLIIGKWLIVEIGAPSQLQAEIMADSTLLAQAVFIDMIANEELPSEVLAGFEEVGEDEMLPDSLIIRIHEAVAQRSAAMSFQEKDSLAALYAHVAIADLGFVDRILATMTGWDLLWFFLAVGTAWKLTTVASTREETGVVAVPAAQPQREEPPTGS